MYYLLYDTADPHDSGGLVPEPDTIRWRRFLTLDAVRAYVADGGVERIMQGRGQGWYTVLEPVVDFHPQLQQLWRGYLEVAIRDVSAPRPLAGAT